MGDLRNSESLPYYTTILTIKTVLISNTQPQFRMTGGSVGVCTRYGATTKATTHGAGRIREWNLER